MKRNRWLSAVLLVLVAVLLVAGCGGGDDEGTDTGGGGAAAADQTLKWGLGSEFQLDPGLATDTTSAKLVLNIYDPLVKLGDDLEAVPAMAESWDVEGAKVVYHLLSGAKWSNGDPVTAKDYEYAWKRAVSPELGSDYSYQLYGIKGAVEYNECEKNCAALRDKVGVKATDDQTLEVTLTSPQPWFIQQSAHRALGVPAGAPEDGRAVRRALDAAAEHRHERSLQGRGRPAQRVDHAREEPGVA